MARITNRKQLVQGHSSVVARITNRKQLVQGPYDDTAGQELQSIQTTAEEKRSKLLLNCTIY